jgi:hypothetical protein
MEEGTVVMVMGEVEKAMEKEVDWEEVRVERGEAEKEDKAVEKVVRVVKGRTDSVLYRPSHSQCLALGLLGRIHICG